ncbi:hypothetical protein ACFE04_018326 [Oxalis oulophora]
MSKKLAIAFVPDVEGEALIEFRNSLNDCNNKISDWNYYLVSPYSSWSYVACSTTTRDAHVVSLELQDNYFSGPLPDYLGDLIYLQYLNLANNKFNGSIPTKWAQLTNLKQLITGFTLLDLSSNNLSGRIPVQLFSVPTFNFSGTRLICGSTIKQPCVAKTLHPETSKSKFGVAVALACVIAFILLSFGVTFAYRCLQLKKLKDELFVDVADQHNPGGEAAFQREVQLISVAVHKNLLRLIGFCTTSSERILIYPFMSNLSVAYRLRDLKSEEKGLDWPTRKRVAFGVGNGLEYLHEYCNPKIIHRDLKAANILLDEKFEAVLGDFGLAKLVDAKLTHVTTQIRGTMGHIAPEYLSTGKSSEKTDVFGYGVTLLELVTGQCAIDFARLEEEEDVVLLDHIKKLLSENRLHDMVDGNLKTYDAGVVAIVLQVALLCTQSSPEERPRMAEVVKMLQGVGVAERWGEWEQMRNEGISGAFNWGDEASVDEEAIQLWRAR